MYIYTVKPLTDHLHRSTTILYRSHYLGHKESSIHYHCTNILKLPKPTVSLNGPFKVGPKVGRFRKGLLYYQRLSFATSVISYHWYRDQDSF